MKLVLFLTALRKARGVTQVELAKRMKVEQSYLSRLESFCGETADLLVSNPDGDRRERDAVYCMGCDSWGPPVPHNRDADDAAWAAWNSRDTNG